MDIFLSAYLSVPLPQVVLLLALSTLALFFGRIKLALLINYCFTLYWGYLANLSTLTESGVFKIEYFSVFYFGFGLVILLMALIGFSYYRG